MIFFTGDHHFFHRNIIKYCNRPFTSVREMDAELIKRWNAKITPDDRVYHLGDFTLGDRETAKRYFSELNGNICVLANRWHHDRRWLPASVDKTIRSQSGELNYVNIFPPMVVLQFSELSETKHPKAIVLCHYPLAKWDRKHYGSWHLYGHSHGQFDNGGLSMDVGVDANNFYPVSLEEIAEIMRKRKGENYVDR